MKKIFLGLMALTLLASTEAYAGGGKKKKAKKDKAKIECKEQCCDKKCCVKDTKTCDMNGQPVCSEKQ